MIENEKQLMNAYETITKMNRLKERCAGEPSWHPSGRRDVADGIESQIRNIEREIGAYLAMREAQVA